MSDFIQLGKTSELNDETMKEVSVQGCEILLARVGDRYYTVDNRCPHMSGRLAQGKLQGTIVTYPRHSSQFDLKDGHVVRWLKGSGLAVQTFGPLVERVFRTKGIPPLFTHWWHFVCSGSGDLWGSILGLPNIEGRWTTCPISFEKIEQ